MGDTTTSTDQLFGSDIAHLGNRTRSARSERYRWRSQASREDRRWKHQRNEERRREAATAVSDAWAFFDETQPEWIVHSPPDIAHEEFDKLDSAYSRLGPPLRRIVIVDTALSTAVEQVISEMRSMIGQIAKCNRDDQEHPEELASALIRRQQGLEAFDR